MSQKAKYDNEKRLADLHRGRQGGGDAEHEDNRRDTNGAGTATSKGFKGSIEYKPKDTLCYESDLKSLDYFASSCEAYYRMSVGKEGMTAVDQQQLFKTFIDSALWAKLSERLQATTDFAGCIELTKAIFEEKFPKIHRRTRALTARQETGETHLDYLSRFKTLVSQAKFNEITKDQLICIFCVANTTAQKIKEKLLEIKLTDLTMDKITEVSRLHSLIVNSTGE